MLLMKRSSVPSTGGLLQVTPRRSSMAQRSRNTNDPADSPWLLGRGRDLALIVATPLLILPAMMLARSRWADASIVLFIAAFGQLGHNLPGMMRAYGDRALFERYKTRFIVAPIVLVAVCVLAVVYHLHGLILVTAVWAIWHALMQTHGFARIYDAKAKSFDAPTRWLDFAMTFTWFGGAIILCDQPMTLLLTHFYNSGGPTIPAGALSVVRTVWVVAMSGATVLFLANALRCWWREGRFSGVKHLLLAISIAFYWYAYSGVQNILVGAAMFDLFHDIQYLTIVWVFNRKRAESDAGAGAFTRFVFGRSGALIGVYLGLIMAFGSLRYVEEYLTAGVLRDLLTGVIATMGLLHYYYDGFIWKVRDGQVRKTLGLRGMSATRQLLSPTWIQHGAKWGLFAFPLVALAAFQIHGRPASGDRSAALATTLPNDEAIRFDYGRLLEDSGEYAEATRHYDAVLRRNASHPEANLRMGLVARRLGKFGISERYLAKAVSLRPTDTAWRVHYSRTLAGNNKLAAAERELHRVLELDPDSKSARINLGIVLAMAGRPAAAEEHLRKALSHDPRNANIHFNLGNVLLEQHRRSEAAKHFQRALEVNPLFVKAARQLQRLRETGPTS